MNWLVFHIASGEVFFTGIAMLLIAVSLSLLSNRIVRRIIFVMASIGLIAVVISSTAIPWWCYGVAAAATIFWIVAQFKTELLRWSAIGVFAAWGLAIAMEMPFHFIPKIETAGSPAMTIIGDSVSAGAGGSDKAVTWPKLLAASHHVTIQDLSHVGETAASALKRIMSASIEGSIVIVEIGGNDLMGSTSSAKFQRDLDVLLGKLVSSDRQLVMFELPLPPFCHEYGRIQRSLARKHDVKLIPKRVFLTVIATGDSTIDSIHLSQAGHELMAEQVWQIVVKSFK